MIVTDGFTGNIALKLIEGVSQAMLGAIRDAAMSSARGEAGGAAAAGRRWAGFREEIDPEAQGGAYLLGLRRLGVVPHGRFTRRGFAQAILRAERGAREDGSSIGRTAARRWRAARDAACRTIGFSYARGSAVRVASLPPANDADERACSS